MLTDARAAKAKRLVTMQELEAVLLPHTSPVAPDLFATNQAGLIHKPGIDRIAAALRSPKMKSRCRAAPSHPAPISIKTDLRALETILSELQDGSATSLVLRSVLDNLASGKQDSSYNLNAARYVLQRVTASRPSDREIRRYQKMLCLLFDTDLARHSSLLPECLSERPVHHRTPLGVVTDTPMLQANKIPAGLESCDLRGLTQQTFDDFVATTTPYYEGGGTREPDEYFCELISQHMTAYAEACERVVEEWLCGSVISPTEEVIFGIITLILLRGTNYSVVLKSKLFWNSHRNSYELRSRKPRAGYVPIRLSLGGGVLSDALVKLRKIRNGNAGSPDLLSIWDGQRWRDISATRYTRWLNNFVPRRFSARLSPSQFRTTLAQVTALTADRGIREARKLLDHQSLRQTVEYVDSPYFRLKQDRAAVGVLGKIGALAASVLDSATLVKLGMETGLVEVQLQELGVSLGLPMPNSGLDPLFSVSVAPPSPACDRRKNRTAGMPIAQAGDTAALLGRAAHFAAHNLSTIIKAERSEQSVVSVSVLRPGVEGGLRKTIALKDAMALLSTSIQIVLRFSGISASEQTEALRTTPIFKAGAWRLELGNGSYVKPISVMAAAVIRDFAQCLSAVPTRPWQKPFKFPLDSTRAICQLLEVYGLPAYWHLELGHTKGRPLFTPARLVHGLAYLWWIVAERDLSAFAYQVGDHSFSKIKSLEPKIERASYADNAGTYAQSVVPALALAFTRASPPKAANENQSSPRQAEAMRKRLPMHEYGVDRGLQLDLRIARLERIANGNQSEGNLPCKKIQDVLGWDCTGDGIVALNTRSLTSRHHLHGDRVQQIKQLLIRVKMASRTMLENPTAAPLASPPFMTLSSSGTVEAKKAPPGSGARPIEISSNQASFMLGSGSLAGVQDACQYLFPNAHEHPNLKGSTSTHAVIVDRSTVPEVPSSPSTVLVTKTPPGSGAGLTRASQDLLRLFACDRDLAASTVSDMSRALRSFVRFLFQHGKTIAEGDVAEGYFVATTDDVHSWISNLLDHGLAPSTINKYLARTRRALAELRKVASAGLVAGIDLIAFAIEKAVDRTIRIPRRAVPTVGQLNSIFETLGSTRYGDRNQTLLLLAFSASPRVAEIPSIRPRLLQPGSAIASCTFEQKGSSVRTTSVLASLWEAMRKLQCSGSKSVGGNAGSHGVQEADGPVFKTQSGSQLSSDQMSRIVSAAARKAGCPGITIHRLRALNFTLALQIIRDLNDGIVPDNAAMIAGHSKIKTTERHYLARLNSHGSANDFRNHGVSSTLVKVAA